METVRTTLRLPPMLMEFVKAKAEEHCTSYNAEIIRSVRERMEAEATTQK